MKNDKYKQYLQSEKWRRLKQDVRKRSGGVCERCKVAPAVNVHHKTYARIYKELLTDLIHLCKRCHDLVHGFSDVDLMRAEIVTKDGLEGFYGFTFEDNPKLKPVRQLVYQFRILRRSPPASWIVQLYSAWDGSPSKLMCFSEEYLFSPSVELFETIEDWQAAYEQNSNEYWRLNSRAQT